MMLRMSRTKETPRSAAIYARISRDRRGAGLGVQRQEQECRDLAARLGWGVAEVYADNDLSAYSGKRRPEYERMLADVAAGRVGAVLAWHTDRLHRSPVELERYIDVCEGRRVPTHTVQAGPIDLATPSGRMVARQLGAVARYESEVKTERLRSTMRQQAALGKYHGGSRPFGYEKDGVTVVPEEAAEIAKAASAVAGGESLRSVVRDLNVRGVPTATGKVGKWTSQQLRELLLRPRIAGLSSHNGEVVGAAQWPAIIDEPLWRAVVAVLSNPARQTNVGRAGTAKWLGSGLYVCGVCDERQMRVSLGKSGADSRIPMYRCNNRDAVPGRHVTRNAVALDTFVEELVIERLSRPGEVERLTRRDDTVDTSKLRAEHVEIAERKDELAALFGDGTIDAGQFATASKRLSAREDEITDALASAGWRSPLAPLAGGDVRELWAGLTLGAKRAILSTVVDIVVLPSKRQPKGCIDPNAVGVRWRID
ncbi:recombinase family protein [Mycobacterium sp. SMC-4]|uniref:recombinase family protein n=1 Tax=Mycobacterium sp. SMC-4 TaxID=2857059 RepID=UPI0021B21E35|nr:recombinase family protein [Mycobacterium sp. SMC-4]UXA19818.1 recombinase family protein [Mycobacterium sp. SMC-4]